MTAGAKDRGPEALPPMMRFFNEIGIIEQLARNLFESKMPGGLKLPHFTVLNHFVRQGGAQAPSHLARAFQVTKGAMTNTLSRLEGRGLVKVYPDPRDGRGKLVEITPAGRRAHRAAIDSLEGEFKELGTAFREAEFSDALPLLERVRVYLDDQRNP